MICRIRQQTDSFRFVSCHFDFLRSVLRVFNPVGFRTLVYHGITTGRDKNVGVSPCYFQRMQVENFVNIILTMLCTSFRGNNILSACDYFRDEQSI